MAVQTFEINLVTFEEVTQEEVREALILVLNKKVAQVEVEEIHEYIGVPK